MTFDDAESFDLLLIPGGRGTQTEVANPATLNWIASQAPSAEYVMSVCTGTRLLAAAGVLDGRRATTNKLAFHRVADPWPNVEWVKEARWVEDGKFLTSSGVSAGMDMSLAAIALMHGVELAEQVAVWAEYDWHRNKDHDPFAQVYGLV